MTFLTLQYQGVEMALGGWQIANGLREVNNQAGFVWV